MEDFELAGIASSNQSPGTAHSSVYTDRTRSSLDIYPYVDRIHGCHVSVWDDKHSEDTPSDAVDQVFGPTVHLAYTRTQPKSRHEADWSRFTGSLQDCEPQRSRWINVVGWSMSILSELERIYLDGRPYFTLRESSEQTFGGPVSVSNGREYLWIQTPIWMPGQDYSKRPLLKKVHLKAVMILHT